MGQGTDFVGSKASNNASAANPESNQDLTDMAKLFAKETKGARTGLLGTMEEVLSTGGSTVPIISRSVEATRRASSNALRGTDEDLARSGLAGTPYGEGIRAGQRQEGEIAAGNTAQQFAQAVFQMIPGFVLGQGQTATQGLGASATNSTNLTNNMMGGLFQALNMGK